MRTTRLLTVPRSIPGAVYPGGGWVTTQDVSQSFCSQGVGWYVGGWSEQNNLQTPVKTLPSRKFVGGR